MSKIGRHNGVAFKRQRICDMMPCLKNRAYWWFIYVDGEPTGDHFQTLAEMRQWIENDLPETLERDLNNEH